MTQKEAAFAIMVELKNRGFQAFLVGGAPRNLILGKPVKDWDITTDAIPEQVMTIFPKTIAVGAAFGVITVVMEGINTEVATFRQDASYTDGRHPDSVSYSKTAKEDVSRRDFTINGLLMRQPTEGEGYERAMIGYLADPNLHIYIDYETSTFYIIEDYVGGFNDIHNKIIRCIGDPEKRFAEDALRILRACRFAAQLGFTIDPETMRAIHKLAPTIKKVSEERVTAEVLKIVSSPNPTSGLVALITSGLLDHMRMIPLKTGLVNNLRRFSMFQTNDPTVGMAMLFSDASCVNPYSLLKDGMKLPTDFSNAVFGAIEVRDKLLCGGDKIFLKSPAARKRLMRIKGASIGVELYAQDIFLGNGVIAKDFEEEKVKVGCLTENEAKSLVSELSTLTPEEINPPRLVNGNDLIQMGLEPGENFKFILDTLEDYQLNGLITTREMMLINGKDMVAGA